MEIIAHIHTKLPQKFGVPRQSGLVPDLRGTIVFTPPYRNADALRGIEGFSHLWLIWDFSEAHQKSWSPTVRPPRLGGNTRMGVFATRSPFRPNPIGLSCVMLESVEQTAEFGCVLRVRGADLMDNTPIFDIKPYLPYADCHPEATGGFTGNETPKELPVVVSPELLSRIPQADRAGLLGVLAQDPRPRYQHDPERIYGMAFDRYQVKFRVSADTVEVVSIEKE